MKTQQLSNKLQQLVSDAYRQERKIRMGIIPPPTPMKQQSNKISELIYKTVLKPIVNDLCQNSNHTITYQFGTSIGFYYLLVDSKKFAVMYVPNHATGIVFIKYLNHHGNQCTAPVRLTDTCQILDYLKEFLG